MTSYCRQRPGLDVADGEAADLVELHRETLTGVANGRHAAFVLRHFDLVELMLADKPGENYDGGGQATGHDHVDQQRQISCEIRVRHDCANTDNSPYRLAANSLSLFCVTVCVNQAEATIHAGFSCVQQSCDYFALRATQR